MIDIQACAPNPYVDPYYGGMMTAFGQPLVCTYLNFQVNFTFLIPYSNTSSKLFKVKGNLTFLDNIIDHAADLSDRGYCQCFIPASVQLFMVFLESVKSYICVCLLLSLY